MQAGFGRLPIYEAWILRFGSFACCLQLIEARQHLGEFDGFHVSVDQFADFAAAGSAELPRGSAARGSYRKP